MSKFKIGTLVLAIVAMLAFASTATAKNGGGGDNTPCAKINDFTVTAGYSLDQPALTTSYSISNACFDERHATAAIDTVNETTGFKTRSFWVLSPGLNTSTSTAIAAPDTTVRYTLTIYAPNGKVLESRQQRVTTPSPLVPAA